MKNPFTEEDYKTIDEAIKNRSEFCIEKKFPYSKGGKYEISIKGMHLCEETFDEYRKEMWGEPYFVSWNEYHIGKSGHGYADRADYVEQLGAREYIRLQTELLGFEEDEEQMRWF